MPSQASQALHTRTPLAHLGVSISRLLSFSAGPLMALAPQDLWPTSRHSGQAAVCAEGDGALDVSKTLLELLQCPVAGPRETDAADRSHQLDRM